MTTILTQIIACASNIMEVVGSNASRTDALPLTLSGRSPCLPEVAWADLIESSVWCRTPVTTQSRVSEILSRRLQIHRGALLERYRTLIGGLYSHRHLGLEDGDVEDRLILAFESSYLDHVEKIRKILRRIGERSGPAVTSNSRGGFGDVSHPLITQANNSAHPSNLRNSIQLHKVPPLDRN